ncbi:MAG: mechanosensitive ion channel family protein [Geminicoccales bacterium]
MRSSINAFVCFLCISMASLQLPLATFSYAQEVDDAAGIAQEIETTEIKEVVKTLEDPEARARLIEQLKVLSTAEESTKPVAKSVDELGLTLVEILTQRVNDLAAASVELSSAVVDLPNLSEWFWQQLTNEEDRRYWIDLFTKLAVVLGVSLIGYHVTRYFLQSTVDRFYNERPESLTTVVPLALLRGGLRMIPILTFTGLGYGLLTLLGGWNGNATTILGQSLVDATTFCMVLIVGARTVLAPVASGLRLIRLSDKHAQYLFSWIRRFIFLIAYSYVIFQNELILKINDSISGAIERALGFIVVMMLIFLVLRNRKPVAQWLRGNGADDNDQVMRVLGRCRRLVADIWPLFAIFYIISTYLIWALAIPGGFSLLFRGGVLTTFLLAIARPLAYGVERALGQGLSLGPEIRRRYPALERRINRYLALLQGFAVSVVYFIILLALVHIWGFDLFAWIGGWFSAQTWSRLSNAGSIILVSFLIWELAGTLIENYLDAVDETGKRVERSGRARTLLPLLRTFLFLIIVVIVTLTTLSTLGVDVTPVLAAAGVIGIAIGFGSQKLVQDIITGLFILFQDTIAVGDVVDVAGHTGTVERISVRTIELRDLSGRVHTVPFSEVTTITNHTKDFSYAELSIGVAYRENTDEVVEVIKQIGAELETDMAYAASMLEPIQVLGVDELADSAVIIKARIKTKPMTQWGVKRGFNRLMKYRFDELGIEMPFPHQTVYFGEDKSGQAPAAQVRLDHTEQAERMSNNDPTTSKPTEHASFRVIKDGNGGEEEGGS